MALPNQTKAEIEHAASEAVRVIGQAAEQASRVVANAAAEAVKVANVRGSDDHDMLVRIDEQLKGVKSDILNLSTGVSAKIEDHEKRIFDLEKGKGVTNVLLSIGIGVLTVLTGMLIYHLFQQPMPNLPTKL